MEDVIDIELQKPKKGATFKVVKSFWGRFKPRTLVKIIDYEGMRDNRPRVNKETATYVSMHTGVDDMANDHTHFQTGGRGAFYASVCCKKHFEV